MPISDYGYVGRIPYVDDETRTRIGALKDEIRTRATEHGEFAGQVARARNRGLGLGAILGLAGILLGAPVLAAVGGGLALGSLLTRRPGCRLPTMDDDEPTRPTIPNRTEPSVPAAVSRRPRPSPLSVAPLRPTPSPRPVSPTPKNRVYPVVPAPSLSGETRPRTRR